MALHGEAYAHHVNTAQTGFYTLFPYCFQPAVSTTAQTDITNTWRQLNTPGPYSNSHDTSVTPSGKFVGIIGGGFIAQWNCNTFNPLTDTTAVSSTAVNYLAGTIVNNVIADTEGSGIIISQNTSTLKPIWYRNVYGATGLTSIFTGQYAGDAIHTDSYSKPVLKYFLFGSTVFEQLWSGSTVRFTKYTLGASTVTEVSTQTITPTNYLSPLNWLDSGYATAIETITGLTSADTTKVLWIYSGGTFSSVTTGWPSSGHRAQWAVPVATGVISVGLLIDNGASNDSVFTTTYSGGAFGTASATITTSGKGYAHPIHNESCVYAKYNEYISVPVGTDYAGGTLTTALYEVNYSTPSITTVVPVGGIPNQVRGTHAKYNNGSEWIIATINGFIAKAGWDLFTPGQLIKFKLYEDVSQQSIPNYATSIDVYAIDENDATGSFFWHGSTASFTTGTINSATYDFYVTSDGTAGGTARNGVIRLKVVAASGGVGAWTVDSEIENAASQKGYLRIPVAPSGSGIIVTNDSAFTTKPNPFAWTETEYLKFQTTTSTNHNNYSNRTFDILVEQNGSAVVTVTATTGNAIYTGSTLINDSYATGNVATDYHIKVNNNSSGAGITEKWTAFQFPTGSEYTWTDKYNIVYKAVTNIDKHLIISSSGTGPLDNTFKTYHPTGGTTNTLFNRLELVSGYCYVFNARSGSVTTTATITGTVSTASGNDISFVLGQSGATNLYSGSYTIASGHEAVHDDVGQWKKLIVRPSGANTPTGTGSNSWFVSSWWKVDSHPQKSTTLNKDPMTNNSTGEDINYIISADEMYWWGHVQNVRGEDLNAASVSFVTVGPNASLHDFGTQVTDASGWTSPFVDVAPTSPAGAWQARALAFKTGVVVASGSDPQGSGSASPNWGFGYETTTGGVFNTNTGYQIVNFISAYRNNIVLALDWGVYGTPGKWAASGDTIMVGVRPFKDGSGKAVDANTTPHMKIAKFNQTDGSITYYVGNETNGANMTKVSTTFPTTGDLYAWYYLWDTSSGVPWGNYVFMVDCLIDGAVSYDDNEITIRSGYALQSDFVAHTGLTANVHGAQGAVVGVTNSHTLLNKTMSGAIMTGTTTVVGTVDMSGFTIINLLAASTSSGALNKGQLDTHAALISGTHGAGSKYLATTTGSDQVYWHNELHGLTTGDDHTQYTLTTLFSGHTGATVVHGASGFVVGDSYMRTRLNVTPENFALWGIKKTYLNPNDPIKSLTHNLIQGIADHSGTMSYDANGYVTGLTLLTPSNTNTVAITRDASGNATVIAETIQNILSGSFKTVTTTFNLNASGKSTGFTTVVT